MKNTIMECGSDETIPSTPPSPKRKNNKTKWKISLQVVKTTEAVPQPFRYIQHLMKDSVLGRYLHKW